MTVAVVATVPILTKVSAIAAGTGTGVSYTLEGCRATTNAYLAGTFVCPPAQYTTGNLGSGWNELDFVPGRVTVHAGNSAPSIGQDISFDVAVDNCSNGTQPCTGTPGYDELFPLTLNGLLSSPSGCGSAGNGAPGYDGVQLFRQVDVHLGAKNIDCVYDYYARLAFGSHNYSGSSLHYNLTNTSHASSGIGNKEVSIPVKPILPIGFTKTESATQGSDVTWSVSKSLAPLEGTVSFPDTCDSTASTSQVRHITVSWTKNSTGGAIAVDGAISLSNPTHRDLRIDVSDQLYDGLTGTTADGNPKLHSENPLGPGGSVTYHDMWSTSTPPTINVAAAYHDVASATVTDVLSNDVINLQDATASASVTTLAPTSGNTAVVTDVESLTDGTSLAGTTAASDYTFSVAAPASGTLYTTYDPAHPANNVYAANAATNGPLTWVSPSQSGNGSITFTKTIHVVRPTTETATLHDVATVTGDQQAGVPSSPLGVAINAGAKVSIAINKTTTIAQQDDATFTFNAWDPGPPSTGQIAGTVDVTIPGGTVGPVQPDPSITGLDPGTLYYIDEPAVAPFPAIHQPDVEVDLPNCSTEVFFVNTAAPATAQVQKITDPVDPSTDFWEFTLTGLQSDGTTPVDDLNGGSDTQEVVSGVTANTDYVAFPNSVLDQDGATYTITETLVTHWDTTDVTGDVAGDAVTTDVGDSSTPATCSFVWTLSKYSDSVFECTFTNTEESNVTVVKTQDGGQPSNQYAFRLCPGISKSNCTTGTGPAGSSTLKTNDGEQPVGTLDFGYFKPGDYTLCELSTQAGWHSTLQDMPYNGTIDGLGNICATFTLDAGTDKTFTIDNSSPKGNALTIGYWKHWNSINVGHSAQAGHQLMDGPDCCLPQPLGSSFTVTNATQGVAVLSNPSMKYAENGLAAQLLAAELNITAGALPCGAITTAINHGNALLSTISYAGPVGHMVGNKYPGRADWTSTQGTLDKYNNNLLC